LSLEVVVCVRSRNTLYAWRDPLADGQSSQKAVYTEIVF
jgi:hypothetical protein